MADENDEKTKRTVPGMERSFKGIAAHAAAVLEMNWDKERKVFRDPFTVTLALFKYAELMGTLSEEADARNATARKQLEQRIAAFEARLATFETWKVETEKQAAEMAAGFEEMVRGNPQTVMENVRTNLEALRGKDAPPLPPPSPPVIDVAADVVPLKPPEKGANNKKREEKNGGVA